MLKVLKEDFSVMTNYRFYRTSAYVSAYNWETDS